MLEGHGLQIAPGPFCRVITLKCMKQRAYNKLLLLLHAVLNVNSLTRNLQVQ